MQCLMKEGFTKSLCRPSAFKQREYATASICKPHIFRRTDLFNTEIIITILSKPVIKSALSVRTYGRQFHQLRANIFCTKTQGLKCASIQNYFQAFKSGYKNQSFCMNLWRAVQPQLHTQRRSIISNSPYGLKNNYGGVSNGHLR